MPVLFDDPMQWAWILVFGFHCFAVGLIVGKKVFGIKVANREG